MKPTSGSRDWTRPYAVLLLHQMLVTGLLGLVALALVHESHRACEAAELALPSLTEFYLLTLGVPGLLTAVAASAAFSLVAMAFRRKFAAVAVTSFSLLATTGFLAVGILSAVFPLLMAIRNMLPPDERW